MKVPGQKENPEESEVGTKHISGNSSGPIIAKETPILAIERSGSSGKRGGTPTGPRTELGKQRASRNATKHGVFSKIVVLKGESPAEYEELLEGMREAFQPEGALEELLVEKLATMAWRQRRLLLAGGVEILKNTVLVEWGYAPGFDRLLHYEAHLERNFDRTLSQLERLQRMRLGQPVLPKLEVRHSLS